MKKSKGYLVIAITAVITTGVVVGGVSYARGELGKMGIPHHPEEHQAVEEAIANNDYEAWLAAVGEENKLIEIITEENFPLLVEIYNLKQEGKYEEAREIWQELGIEKAGKKGDTHYKGHKGKIGFFSGELEVVEEAIENNDYEAWLQAVGEDSKIAGMITEENFPQFVEMHELMEEGNHEEALKIKEELGMLGRKGWFKR